MKNGIALVIGNNTYAQEKHRLNNAVNDAQDIADKLATMDFEVLLTTDCAGQGFEEALITFGSAIENYRDGLFYYSGHGLQMQAPLHFGPLAV